jgi:TDG/mug DNA glycosylase family protein
MCRYMFPREPTPAKIQSSPLFLWASGAVHYTDVFKRKDNQMLVQGFDPIVGKNARIVILGTLPGEESLSVRQYYGDSSNAFWYIIQQLFGIARGLSYDEIRQSLIKNRIAVWDVLQRAQRSGSQDSKIIAGTEVANDFAAFFSAYPSIKGVFFNGGKPKKYFHKLVIPVLQMEAGFPRLNPALQSTSGVNTHHTAEKKVELWRVVKRAARDIR